MFSGSSEIDMIPFRPGSVYAPARPTQNSPPVARNWAGAGSPATHSRNCPLVGLERGENVTRIEFGFTDADARYSQQLIDARWPPAADLFERAVVHDDVGRHGVSFGHRPAPLAHV